MNGGEPHGPYVRRFWMEGGKKRSRYVRLDQVETVKAAVERHRTLHMSARAIRRMTLDFIRRSDEVIALLEALKLAGRGEP
jgi:hypothetical protein